MVTKEGARKGITPVISVIILLFIAIAIIGIASQFIFGIISGPTEKAFQIPPNSAFCKKAGSDYYINVYVRNAGIGTLTEKDFVVHEIDGASVTFISANLPIEKGSESKLIIDHKLSDCPQGDCIGLHTLIIGTSAGIQELQIRCS